MQVRFTTESQYTLEEAKEFSEAASRHYRGKGIIVLRVLLGFQLLALCITNNMKNETADAVLNIILDVIVLGLIWLVIVRPISKIIMNYSIKHMWENSGQKDFVTYFGFFEDFMETNNRQAVVRTFYDQLYDIIETDTHIYPMTGRNQGYIIKKANCSQELIEFLREKKAALRKA